MVQFTGSKNSSFSLGLQLQGQVGKLKKKKIKPTKISEPEYEKLRARNTKQNISKLFRGQFYSPKWASRRACLFTDDRGHLPVLFCLTLAVWIPLLYFSSLLLQTAPVNKNWTYPLPYLPFLFFLSDNQAKITEVLITLEQQSIKWEHSEQ